MANIYNPFGDFSNIGGGRGGDLNYGGRGGTSGSPGNQSSLYWPATICHLCNTPGHSAANCRRRSALVANDPNPHRLRPYGHPPDEPAAESWDWDWDFWVVDSGSTKHVTPDLDNIPFLSDQYDGSAMMLTADGSASPITHRGTSYIDSPAGRFVLSDVACAPEAVENYLSVHEFTKSNGVSIEFFPAFFLVKDRDGVALAFGLWKDGSYRMYLKRKY